MSTTIRCERCDTWNAPGRDARCRVCDEPVPASRVRGTRTSRVRRSRDWTK